MTDPEFSGSDAILSLSPLGIVAKIMSAKVSPDALLPTMGGQTGLNTMLALHEHGVLAHIYNVELIGARGRSPSKGRKTAKFFERMSPSAWKWRVSGCG